MASAEVIRAISLLRYNNRKSGKPHARIHLDTSEDNLNRRRALEGICGVCPSLVVEFSFIDGGERPILRCKKDFSPKGLYSRTKLGETAKCPGFSSQAK